MGSGRPRPDAALRQVPWRDLVVLRPAEILRELILPLPFLALSLAAARWRPYPLALALSFVFLLAGLRIVHGGCHLARGLKHRASRPRISPSSQAASTRHSRKRAGSCCGEPNPA